MMILYTWSRFLMYQRIEKIIYYTLLYNLCPYKATFQANKDVLQNKKQNDTISELDFFYFLKANYDKTITKCISSLKDTYWSWSQSAVFDPRE